MPDNHAPVPITDSADTRPCGWYPNPEGGEHYWTGTGWSPFAPVSSTPEGEASRAALYPYIPVSVSDMPPVPAPRSRSRLRPAALIAAAAVVVGVLGLGAASQLPTHTEFPLPDHMEPAEPVPTPHGPRPLHYSTAFTDATVTDGRYAYAILDKMSGTQVFAPDNDLDSGTEARGTFLIVTLGVRNVSDKSHLFSGVQPVLVDSRGNEYTPAFKAAEVLNRGTSVIRNLAPGDQLEYVVAFDVPEGSTLLRINFPSADGDVTLPM